MQQLVSETGGLAMFSEELRRGSVTGGRAREGQIGPRLKRVAV